MKSKLATLKPVVHVGIGQVRHKRLRPKRNAFAYGNWFVWLPMRQLGDQRSHGALNINTPGLVSYFDQDHGDGRGPEQGGALAWLQELLQAEGVLDADGDVWLHTYPRVWGYTFKPVSFWYCHRTDGRLRAIVAEVNNTFGERHCYLLDNPAWGLEQTARKVFHVSPFCDIKGSYVFRFMTAWRHGQAHTVARIDYDDGQGTLLQTSVSGLLQPATEATLRHVQWRYGPMTLMVMARIHWQALKLWVKQTGFRTKPTLPSDFVTR
jgi:uncharacterized protein